MKQIANRAGWAAMIVLLGLAIWSLWWNWAVYFYKARVVGDLAYGNQAISVSEFTRRADDILSFHPELGSPQIAVDFLTYAQQATKQGVRNVPMILAMLEQHLPITDTRTLITAGRAYELLWERDKKEVDYQSAVAYFQLANQRRKGEGLILYRLLCLYRTHNDSAAATEVTAEITHYLGTLNESLVCSF